MRPALATLSVALVIATPLGSVVDAAAPALHLPWKEAGLTERQAAAHLLNRFAYGQRPGEVEGVVKMGLDRWLAQQLAGGLEDTAIALELRALPALTMTTAEIARIYPPPGLVLLEARQAGVIADGDFKREEMKGEAEDPKRRELRDKIVRFARQRGYRPQRELIGQLMTQKLLRALASENQLTEVLTDFWFNHFNVSTTDNQARAFILTYERDAVRPHVLGRFRDLLEATAKHPAMLVYLDNAQSGAADDAPTTMGERIERMPRRRGFGRRPGEGEDDPARRRLRPRGLNENYARELLELHTLGVDGGYSQRDVVEVARAFTGWTMIPPRRRDEVEQRLAQARRAGGLGFVVEGDFLFRADVHDSGAKTVLGNSLPAGRGVEDGLAVLDLLARHPATAHHLATKLAQRFVSDQPPASLVDRLAGVYLEGNGDLRRLVVALAESPEFWSREALAAKIKSPFELAASALRAVGGEVDDPREAFRWIARMGQPLYGYQAPTGFPDRAEAWVNTGSLLNRMNFGLELAAGRVQGVDVDLAALNGGAEPASREEALRTFAGLLLPGRDLASTLELLTPMVAAPDLAGKVGTAAPGEAGRKPSGDSDQEAQEEMLYGDLETTSPVRSMKVSDRLGRAHAGDRGAPSPLAQVVGVILGSPEFQRR